ncbi:MAG: outer membrane beta-barrel family protein, partial [Bacteroidia bacterium]
MEYELSKKNKFQLNLNRRIDMPKYDDTNPFRSYRNQYSYFEGNPFLQPNYSNTIEVTHSYEQLLTNTFTYTRINNIMLDFTRQNDSTKVTTETIKNMNYKNYCAYSFFLLKSLRPWWDISINSTFSYSEFVGDVSGVAYKTSIFGYAPALTNTFTALKNNKIEITTFYNSPINDGVLQIKSRWMLSFAIKKTFLNEKLDLSIGIDDLFNTGYYRTGVNFDNQNWNFRVNQDSRRVALSINYNFG